MRLETYSEYKQIDHPWLESIPTHWTAKRFKFMAAIKNGRDHKHLEVETGGYPVIGSGGQFGYASAFLYDGESVLLGRKGTVNKPLYVSNPFWTVDTMFYTVIGSKFHVKFLYYCSLTIPFDRYLTSTALPSMTQEGLGNIVFAVPLLKEQQAIATFLDHETARIDTLIEKQQKLIALLKEKRQAVISHAVTKGLDSTAPMKQSGVKWLGDVPAHWEVTKLGFNGSTQNGISKGGEYFGTGYPFVSYGDVYNNESLPSEVHGLVQSTASERHTCSVKGSDVFFTRTSETLEEIGFTSTCFKSIPNATFAGFLIRFRPRDELLFPGYSQYFFRCELHRAYFVKEMNLVTRASLSQGLLKKLPVLIPPFDEQKMIAESLDQKSKKFSDLIQRALSAIELLQERRTALISAAVTGKIDVRNHPSAREAA